MPTVSEVDVEAKHSAVNESDDEFDDLDAMVLAEIESLHTAPAKRRNPASHQPRRTESTEMAVEAEADIDKPSTKTACIYGHDTQEEGRTGEESEGLFDACDDDRLFDTGGDPEESPASLFSVEERAFMERAVGFLTGRDNADVILGQIWERLTSEQPESFYDPVEAEHDISLETDNAADDSHRSSDTETEPSSDGGAS